VKTSKSILLLYLANAMLITDLLAITYLLIMYHPDPDKTSGSIGIGVILLDCTLWSILFAVAGSISLFNTNKKVSSNLVFSFISFLFAPILLVALILRETIKEWFGFTETACIFLIVEIVFFFKFKALQRSKISKCIF
jgi:hypothetical protein